MTTDDREPMEGQGADSDTSLRKIAQLLECPVEVFTDGVHAPHDVKQTRELLNLWGDLDTNDREQVLALVRKLAGA